MARQDVIRFIHPEHQATLKLWDVDFFMSEIEKMQRYLPETGDCCLFAKNCI
ncbi:MAG: hypothetical protein V4496_02150 [Pseudomonadota bacterium]